MAKKRELRTKKMARKSPPGKRRRQIIIHRIVIRIFKKLSSLNFERRPKARLEKNLRNCTLRSRQNPAPDMVTLLVNMKVITL